VASSGLTLPEGTYMPVVHLERAHSTIRLPNPIRLDTTPPVIKVPHKVYTHISPDRDGRHDAFRAEYSLDGPAHAILLVNGKRVQYKSSQALEGELRWNGKLDGVPARPRNYVISAAARDPAGNVSKPFPFAVVTVRYVALGRTRILVRPRGRFAVLVLTDAPCFDWLMNRGRGHACTHTLRMRAPKKPGVYRLYVEAAGHAAKALVVVA
jgi:hypothetical protein